MVESTYYYLTIEEIQHYRYMLSRGYGSKVVDLGSQQFLVFAVVGKPHAGIAWPTVTGGFDGLPSDADALFEPDASLQAEIMPHIVGSTIKIILFPKYAD